MDLDQVADELYVVLPEEFVARRKERQDTAKADGDKALAKEVGALPKPSAAAWVCNQLVREHRAEIENLVELGDLLRRAQENLAGDQLRALDVQRRQLVTALTRQARGLAAGRGHPVSTAVATQVEETLRAAMADPEAGRALLSGRLTTPMSYSGLGTTVSRPDLRLVHPPPTVDRTEKQTSAPTKQTGEPAAARRARQQEERRRAADEKRVRELATARSTAEEATATAQEAVAALEEHRQRAGELAARRSELQARVDELTDELADAERAAADAAAALRREERRRAAIERDVADAVEARERADAHVTALADP